MKNFNIIFFILIFLLGSFGAKAFNWPNSSIQLGSNTPTCGEYNTLQTASWQNNRYWVFQSIAPGQSICVMPPVSGMSWYVYKGDGSAFTGTEVSYSGPHAGPVCIDNNTATNQTFTLLCTGTGNFSSFTYSSYCLNTGSMTLNGGEINIGDFYDLCPTIEYCGTINSVDDNRIFHLILSPGVRWCSNIPAGLNCGLFPGNATTGYTTNELYTGSLCIQNNGNADLEYIVKFEGPVGSYIMNFDVVCGNSYIPLPLNLLSFVASSSKEGNLLSWEVTDVKNFSHFEIEKSWDGKNFQILNTMSYAGDRYEYLDKQFFNAYYRLKIVDINNNFSNSAVLYCDNKNEKELSIYPNPFGDKLYFSAEAKEVKIRNLCGATVFYKRNNISSQIDLSCLGEGIYFIQVNRGSSQKIIK